MSAAVASDGVLLHLLRHGLPETPGLMIGHSDVPPLPSGIATCMRQVQDLAVTGIVSSDLARARLAAEAIAAERDIPCRIDARWRELDFGAWEGADPAMLPRADLARFWQDPDASPPPGGECWAALRARVGAALAGIAVPTLVVTHAGAMRAALACLLSFDHRQVWSLDLPYGALLSLRVWPGADGGAQIVGLKASCEKIGTGFSLERCDSKICA